MVNKCQTCSHSKESHVVVTWDNKTVLCETCAFQVVMRSSANYNDLVIYHTFKANNLVLIEEAYEKTQSSL